MSKITVVGLGPGDPELLTSQAEKALMQAPRIVLRTARHAVAGYLTKIGKQFETLDALYDQADNFEEFAKIATDRLCDLSREEPLVYGVPGQGLLEDDTVGALLHMNKVEKVLPGLPPMAQALAEAASECRALSLGNVRIVPAAHIHAAVVHAHQPLVVTSLDDVLTAGEVKLALSPIYGDEAPCVVVSLGKVTKLALYELDRFHEFDHNSALIVLGRDGQAPMDYDDLKEIIHRLRSPGGCPWDREQTHESLRPYLIEESYEAIDAINREDAGDLANELGDVLLQVMLHGEIAEEMDEFTHLTVTDEVCRKMIHRHPHVFGEGKADTAGAVVAKWDEIKQKEKRYESRGEAMAAIARALPALIRAQKVQAKAAKVGFDWPDAKAALGKMTEEIQEFKAAWEQGTIREQAMEAGDILFTAVNIARLAGADSEEVLTKSTDKFIERFSAMEARMGEKQLKWEQLTPENMDELWKSIKKNQKN